MGAWADHSRDAEVSTGGEFPTVEDDLYEMVVQDVSEPTEEVNRFKEKATDPDMVTRFYVSLEITSGDSEGVILRKYITLPPAYLEDGHLGEKSNLFKVMTALGIDMSGRFRVDPPSWQGMSVRGMVESPRDKDGEQTGWPRVGDLKPPRAKREPVGAGSRKRGAAAVDDDD